MYETDIKMINEKINNLESLRKKIDTHDILLKIKQDGSIDNLSKNELKHFIYKERINYELNHLKLDLVEIEYAKAFQSHPKEDYQLLVAQYVFDIAKNPIGYTHIKSAYSWIKTINDDPDYKPFNIMDYTIHTMDINDPIFAAFFSMENEPVLVKSFEKFHEYFYLRYNMDFCHDYCLKHFFTDDQLRYEPFKVDRKKKTLTYNGLIKNFKIKDYQKALNQEFVNKL